MSAAVIALAVFSGLCFITAAASLLADYLAAHRKVEPEHRGHVRVGMDRRGP